MVALVFLIAPAASAKCRVVHQVPIHLSQGKVTIDAAKDVLVVGKGDCVRWVVAPSARRQYVIERVHLIAEEESNASMARPSASSAAQKDLCARSPNRRGLFEPHCSRWAWP